MESKWLSVGQVASELGISPSCVRRWEKLGILPLAARHPLNGYRLWPRRVVEELAESLAPEDPFQGAQT